MVKSKFKSTAPTPDFSRVIGVYFLSLVCGVSILLFYLSVSNPNGKNTTTFAPQFMKTDQVTGLGTCISQGRFLPSRPWLEPREIRAMFNKAAGDARASGRMVEVDAEAGTARSGFTKETVRDFRSIRFNKTLILLSSPAGSKSSQHSLSVNNTRGEEKKEKTR